MHWLSCSSIRSPSWLWAQASSSQILGSQRPLASEITVTATVCQVELEGHNSAMIKIPSRLSLFSANLKWDSKFNLRRTSELTIDEHQQWDSAAQCCDCCSAAPNRNCHVLPCCSSRVYYLANHKFVPRWLYDMYVHGPNSNMDSCFLPFETGACSVQQLTGHIGI